jgi:molybdopterin-containing oxidoreductase family membrane subunit
MVLDVFALLVFATPALHRHAWILKVGCASAIVGVWIEKGMGLVIPGFVPSTLGEIVEYGPSFTEFCVSAAVWAMGALVYTLLLKAAVPIELGQLRDSSAAGEPAE